jgi:hypothetical protein
VDEIIALRMGLLMLLKEFKKLKSHLIYGVWVDFLSPKVQPHKNK